jgi:hypothetical protein
MHRPKVLSAVISIGLILCCWSSLFMPRYQNKYGCARSKSPKSDQMVFSAPDGIYTCIYTYILLNYSFVAIYIYAVDTNDLRENISRMTSKIGKGV